MCPLLGGSTVVQVMIDCKLWTMFFLFFYNDLFQISCVSGSPELSNRVRFRRYFQLLANAARMAHGFYGIIEEYKWRRVALIVQNENLFTTVSGNVVA